MKGAGSMWHQPQWLIVVAWLAWAPVVGAQSFTWNLAGNGTWNDANSWNPNTAFPNSTAQSAVFGNGITATAAVNLTSGVTVNTLSFDNITGVKAYTIGAAGLGVTFGGANSGLSMNANVTSIGEQTLNSSLAGTGNITVNAGRLTLANDLSTVSGAVNVNAGRLRILPSNQKRSATRQRHQLGHGGQRWTIARRGPRVQRDALRTHAQRHGLRGRAGGAGRGLAVYQLQSVAVDGGHHLSRQREHSL
jgi:autotransporter-associated beta strand protein